MVGNFRVIDSIVDIVSDPLGSPFYFSSRFYWTPLSVEKIRFVFITFSYRHFWIYKVCLTFHQHVSFNSFGIETIFSLIFNPVDTLFHFNWSLIDLFDSSFLQNFRSNWVHFSWCAHTPYQQFGEVPHPLPQARAWCDMGRNNDGGLPIHSLMFLHMNHIYQTIICTYWCPIPSLIYMATQHSPTLWRIDFSSYSCHISLTSSTHAAFIVITHDYSPTLTRNNLFFFLLSKSKKTVAQTRITGMNHFYNFTYLYYVCFVR